MLALAASCSVFLFSITSRAAQMPLLSPKWSVELGQEFDKIGPFPIHAREQHFLEPSFPIDVTLPLNLSTTYSSSYADGGTVSWSKDQVAANDVLEVSFPEIRWKSLRDTEGWAALQHHAVLRTTLTVCPPPSAALPLPNLHIQLIGGSYFTIVRHSGHDGRQASVPRWYAGNIYDMERALPRVVELPQPPSLNEPTTYDMFISGDYEIRLFGDPRIQQDSDTPVQVIKLTAQFDENFEDPIVWEPTLDVIPDLVAGWSFGDAIGVGIRSKRGRWSVNDMRFTGDLISLEEYFSLSPLTHKFRIAPTQARILPLHIVQLKPLPTEIATIHFHVTLTREKPDTDTYFPPATNDTVTLDVALPLTHLAMWNAMESQFTEVNPVIKGSYFFGIFDSMPTNFLAIPPKFTSEGGEGRTPILALHGAGVDIFSPTMGSLWAQSLPRKDHSWVVIPSGRTSWGLDWHGPSALNAWGVLDAVASILSKSKSSIWGGGKYAIPANPTGKPLAILIGHSNGGQGTWYLASRYPDRVTGLVPASAYIKSQSYVPWTMSRSAHFADPFLEAILQTSLTPDDNDLFLGNLNGDGKGVLAIHGGDDENVPVWHSRELIGVLESHTLNASRIEYLEVPGRPHWFSTVLNNDRVQSFIDDLLAHSQYNETDSRPASFELTVALPSETGSLRGWHVEKLSIPGRLGRVSVNVLERRVSVKTTNILEFSINHEKFGILKQNIELWIDGRRMHINTESETIYFKAIEPRIWKINSERNTLQLSGRLQTILSFPYESEGRPAPLVFVVPESSSQLASNSMSIALRLAHDLLLYHRLDSEIVLNSEVSLASSESDVASALGRGNVVVVGNEAALGLQSLVKLNSRQPMLDVQRTFLSTGDFLSKVHRRTSPDGPELHPGQGILFLHPHPMNPCAKMLLMQSTDHDGASLERVARLFPIRTGIPAPDWMIVGEEGDRGEGNVVAAGLWDSEWNWNALMSWSSTL